MMDIGIQTGVLARVQHILGKKGSVATEESEGAESESTHKIRKVTLRKISAIEAFLAGRKSRYVIDLR